MTTYRTIITILAAAAALAIVATTPRCADANSILRGLGKAGDAVVDLFRGSRSGAKPAGRAMMKHSKAFTQQAVRLFGNDGARLLARAPRADAARMIRYASATGNDTLRNSLMAHYRKGGTRFLDQLARVNERQILTGGLSAAMIVAAYNTSKGFGTVAEESPEVFGGFMRHIANLAAVPYLLFGTGVALFILFRMVYRWRRTKA